MSYTTTIEQRQMYKYHMSNYVNGDYPNNLYHLQTLITFLLGDDNIKKNFELRLKEKNLDYNKIMKSVDTFSTAYSYINILSSQINTLSKMRVPTSEAEKDKKMGEVLKKVRKLIRNEILATCQILPTINKDLIIAHILVVRDTDLINIPIPAPQISGDKLALEGEGEGLKVKR